MKPIGPVLGWLQCAWNVFWYFMNAIAIFLAQLYMCILALFVLR